MQSVDVELIRRDGLFLAPHLLPVRRRLLLLELPLPLLVVARFETHLKGAFVFETNFLNLI